jgi:hypothetical protein
MFQRAISDECLKGLGLDIEYCPFRLEGVAGGTVVFDEALTGVPKTPEGKSNVTHTSVLFIITRDRGLGANQCLTSTTD